MVKAAPLFNLVLIFGKKERTKNNNRWILNSYAFFTNLFEVMKNIMCVCVSKMESFCKSKKLNNKLVSAFIFKYICFPVC